MDHLYWIFVLWSGSYAFNFEKCQSQNVLRSFFSIHETDLSYIWENKLLHFLLTQAFLMSTDWMIWFITFPLDNFQDLNLNRDIQTNLRTGGVHPLHKNPPLIRFLAYMYALVESLVQSYLREFFVRGRSQTTFTRFAFFWPPTPLCLHFLWYKSLQKVNIFDLL